MFYVYGLVLGFAFLFVVVLGLGLRHGFRDWVRVGVRVYSLHNVYGQSLLTVELGLGIRLGFEIVF